MVQKNEGPAHDIIKKKILNLQFQEYIHIPIL